MSTNTLWPLGIAIYFSGSVGEALGANLQRKSLTAEARRAKIDPSYEEKGHFQQRMWVVGFFLYVFAGIFMSFALFFASQTLLAPLQLVLFVANAVFANLINEETFHWLGLDGTFLFLVIVGVTMAIVSAPKHNDTYTNDELIVLMHQNGFIAFWYVAGSFIFAMWLIRRLILASCNGDPSNLKQRWLYTVLNMSYGAIAGTFGGINITLTKTLFSLLAGQFQAGGILGLLSSPIVWVTSFCLIGTYMMQIFATATGLGEASAIIVISAHSVTAEVTAASGGILYFQDYQRFDLETWLMFVGGDLIAIFSVICLSHLRLRDTKARDARAHRAVSDTFLLDVNHSKTSLRCPERASAPLLGAEKDGEVLQELPFHDGHEEYGAISKTQSRVL